MVSRRAVRSRLTRLNSALRSLSLVVERIQFFIGRLQFFLGGFQFLVEGLRLFVRRHEFFNGGFLGRDDRLQILAGGGKLAIAAGRPLPCRASPLCAGPPWALAPRLVHRPVLCPRTESRSSVPWERTTR